MSVKPERPSGGTAGSVQDRRGIRLIASAIAVLVLAIGLFTALAPDASAAGSAVNQCNGVYNGGGQAVECHVIVNNRLNLATGVSSSTSTLTACHGAPAGALTCTTTPLDVLITSVHQCNGSALGGGATLLCTVQVTNTITGDGTSAPTTVNQCIGSGGGGGTQPTVDCSPIASTTGADVTQCNGSANNGGGSRRVHCTVTTSTSSAELPVTINQCNGSAAGGSTVTCTSSITNIFVAVPPPTTSATASRTKPSGSVRPSTATRPTTSAVGRTTTRGTASRNGTATTTVRNGTSTNGGAIGTTSTASTGAGGGTTPSGSGTTTTLASTGVAATRQALLAVVLLAAGAALMMIGRRTGWSGKHR